MTIQVDGMGELVALAEFYGFDADSYPDGDEYTPHDSDTLENDAFEYLNARGIEWINVEESL